MIDRSLPTKKGPWEDVLLEALRSLDVPDGDRECRLFPRSAWETVPDFVWEAERVAVYVDEHYWHARTDQINKDHRKRDNLSGRFAWTVLTFTEDHLETNALGCARLVECALANQEVLGAVSLEEFLDLKVEFPELEDDIESLRLKWRVIRFMKDQPPSEFLAVYDVDGSLFGVVHRDDLVPIDAADMWLAELTPAVPADALSWN